VIDHRIPAPSDAGDWDAVPDKLPRLER